MYFNQDVAKVLEYLLRNFEVHRYESEELITYFLAFHSTGLFIKLLQNINLKESESYHFLETNMKKGVPISQKLLIKQTCLDQYLLDKIFDHVNAMIEMAKEK